VLKVGTKETITEGLPHLVWKGKKGRGKIEAERGEDFGKRE